MSSPGVFEAVSEISIEQRVHDMLNEMTLAEKIGQMCQVDAGIDTVSETLAEEIRAGRIGSIINQVDVGIVNELQRIAAEESRLKIPLIIGRDVIHGFKTVMPIPLGQAATWNTHLVEKCARVAASEAASAGVNWTFAPMLDISRDPRWGRIAESFGEDTYLTGKLGQAMVKGFQGKDLGQSGCIAACVKHFAGYGAAESGQDYATTNIPENELRNVYLPPFRSAIDSGAVTVMTSFSDLNGVPATGNAFLLRQILREEWGFEGFVVSDWDSIRELTVHGFAENDRQAALEAVTAGVDMEMAGNTYTSHLDELVNTDVVDIEIINQAVSSILRVKFQLGLFENPYTDPGKYPAIGDENALAVAKQAALESIVLLKNNRDVLPLNEDAISSLAVVGPLSDAPYEQLGTWIFDGDPAMSITGLQGIQVLAGNNIKINYCQALATSRSREVDAFQEAFECAAMSDAVVLFLGEESILSGEAHCRADISLPGAQQELVSYLKQAGKPVIAIVQAGRPIVLTDILDQVDGLLFAWHPGTMGGAAIADVLFGRQSPSGKLPVTFPAHVGQIPIFYNRKNSGKPPAEEKIVHIDAIDALAPQTSLGMCAFHLDTGFRPLFPFGFGLSYTEFSYCDIRCSSPVVSVGEAMTISAEVTNTGNREAEEIVQLYVRDVVGNVTRPVRELKGFRRVSLQAGEKRTVEFTLHTDDLAFYDRHQSRIIEPGEFKVWIGGCSDTELESGFSVLAEQ